MASSPIYGAETVPLPWTIALRSIAFPGYDFHPQYLPKPWVVSLSGPVGRTVVRRSLSASWPASQPRFIQHKKEAFWFHRFLSIAYDHVINPGQRTKDISDEALEPAYFSDRSLVVVDVGEGTWFTSSGFVNHVDAEYVTILDYSRHQLAKAREKVPLKECKIIKGDLEDLPFKTDSADRYIRAGRLSELLLLSQSDTDRPGSRTSS